MKRLTAIVLAGSLMILVSATTISAAGKIRMRANIPFTFHAGEEQLPAGDYIVELRASGFLATGSTIVIQNAEGSITRVLSAVPGSARPASPDSCLVFHRYGGDYFLSTIRQSTIESDLAKTSAEKAVEVAFKKGAKVQVAASKK